MAAHWVVTGQMILESAAHFGGQGESTADMTLLREPVTGVPLLPGTSLTGALRSHLADVLGGYRSEEHRDVNLLFGASRRDDDDGAQSPLIVFDSLGQLKDDQPLEIRDGVSINPATGTASSHKKFDMEILPAGTIFPVRVELIIENSTKEQEIVGFLAEALAGLGKGDISLGMRRSRGLGSVRVHDWKAMRFDLTSQLGWVSWLSTDHVHPIDDEVPVFDTPFEAIRSAHPELEINETRDARKRVAVELSLQITGDLLVRSPGCDPTAPDVVHLKSAGSPVLPGSSLAGAIRAQALRISRCVRDSQGDGEKWVNRLFGPHIEKSRSSSLCEPSASLLRISENFISDTDVRRQTRIAIDRFTSGVVQGALFDEQVQAGGTIDIRLELREPSGSKTTNAEIGLMLLLLKDLLAGEIPVGGAASVGRGFLMGTAKIYLADGEQYEIASDLVVGKDGTERFKVFIEAFCKAGPIETEEVLI
jgi:CRISPR/Cas system CSM-associated protein Csm3 (group 7 of RAMP superfamily)